MISPRHHLGLSQLGEDYSRFLVKN
jgi:hypothetical protein